MGDSYEEIGAPSNAVYYAVRDWDRISVGKRGGSLFEWGKVS
jgi:hypothetical protein